jgi:uncharacterized protein involved in exopolysaccharide biosynthesis
LAAAFVGAFAVLFLAFVAVFLAVAAFFLAISPPYYKYNNHIIMDLVSYIYIIREHD